MRCWFCILTTSNHDLLQRSRSQLIVSQELIAVLLRIRLVDIITQLYKLTQNGNLCFCAQSSHRLLHPTVCRQCQFILLEVSQIVHCFYAQYISIRIASLIEVLDTVIVQLHDRVTQSLAHILVCSLLITMSKDLCTICVDSLVQIWTTLVNRQPETIGLIILFVFNRLMKEREINHTLLVAQCCHYWCNLLWFSTFLFLFLCKACHWNSKAQSD